MVSLCLLHKFWDNFPFLSPFITLCFADFSFRIPQFWTILLFFPPAPIFPVTIIITQNNQHLCYVSPIFWKSSFLKRNGNISTCVHGKNLPCNVRDIKFKIIRSIWFTVWHPCPVFGLVSLSIPTYQFAPKSGKQSTQNSTQLSNKKHTNCPPSIFSSYMETREASSSSMKSSPPCTEWVKALTPHQISSSCNANTSSTGFLSATADSTSKGRILPSTIHK